MRESKWGWVAVRSSLGWVAVRVGEHLAAACRAPPQPSARNAGARPATRLPTRRLCSSFPPLQAQRQLQLSLEAHGRYISGLLEQSGLKGQLPADLVQSAGLAPAGQPPAEQEEERQEAGQEQQRQQRADASPGALQGGVAAVAAAGLAPLTACQLPSVLTTGPTATTSTYFGRLASGTVGSVSPPSPGLLLQTDLAAAAAQWDSAGGTKLALPLAEAGAAGQANGGSAPKKQRKE